MLLNIQVKLTNKEKEKISKNKILIALRENQNISKYHLDKQKLPVKSLKKIIDISKISLKNNLFEIIKN